MNGKNTLKEIEAGIQAVEKTLKQNSRIKKIAEQIRKNPIDKIYTVGCGSSYWLGFLLCEFLRDDKLDCQPVQASEFYFNPYPMDGKTLVIGFSQSGETSETIKALKKAVKKKAIILTIVNQNDSSMSDIANFQFVTPAGKEHLLATKSFDTALTAAFLFAKFFKNKSVKDAEKIPILLEKALKTNIDHVVKLFLDTDRAYTLGIDSEYGAAGEAGVKLGEAALIETLSMPALEISHGPKANIRDIPVMLIANNKKHADIYESLAVELNAAGARLIVLTSWPDKFKSCTSLRLPASRDLSIFAAIKLSQRLATAIAIAKGHDPDCPPTLNKFVKRKL